MPLLCLLQSLPDGLLCLPGNRTIALHFPKDPDAGSGNRALWLKQKNRLLSSTALGEWHSQVSEQVSCLPEIIHVAWISTELWFHQHQHTRHGYTEGLQACAECGVTLSGQVPQLDNRTGQAWLEPSSLATPILSGASALPHPTLPGLRASSRPTTQPAPVPPSPERQGQRHGQGGPNLGGHREVVAPTTKLPQLPSVGPSPTLLTQLLGVQIWQQRPTKGRYFPRNGVTASSFVPKPEDHRLVWKVATGRVEDSKPLAKGGKLQE